MCIEQMAAEHEAWLRMCETFEKLTLQSVNEKQCQPLVSLIRIWGEELAALRRQQGDDGIRHGQQVKETETARSRTTETNLHAEPG